MSDWLVNVCAALFVGVAGAAIAVLCLRKGKAQGADRRCETCRWCEQVQHLEGGALGACRLRAPVVYVVPDDMPRGRWPLVRRDGDWCGEWEEEDSSQ